MAGAIAMSHLALVETLIKALQRVGQAPTPTISLPRFFGRPQSPSDPTIDEWLADFDVFVRQCGVSDGEKRAVVLIDYLGGDAKDEVLCRPDEVRRDFGVLVSVLRLVFGPLQTVTSLYAEFYSRMQSEGETLAEYSRALIRLHQRIEGAAPTVAERQALAVLGDGALKHQFVVGVREEWMQHELRRLLLRSADRPFIVVREEALCLMCEEEARVGEMRPVEEKAAPALSGPVCGSVLNVSVGDVSVDMELSGVDTVVSGAVGGGLCDLDRVSGCGDTDVSGLDMVVSGAVSGGLCDLDSVSGDGDSGVSGVNTVVSDDLDNVSGVDIVVRVGDMSLSGGGDAVLLGVDGSVCGVNPVLADSILNLCGIDTVVSSVDEPVCGDNSVVTAGEFDVCGCGSLERDETGDVVSVDGVVSCGDDPLLPDAVRVGGRLSVVGDTLVCDSGVAQSGRGDAEVMVAPGLAQPVWVDELICADGSLRPEPPPMNALWLRRGPPPVLLTAAC